MNRLTYDEFSVESLQMLRACISTKDILNDLIKDIKNHKRLYGRSFYMRSIINGIEYHSNWLCDYVSMLYIETTSDFYDAQKRHVQRIIKKEHKYANTSK